MNFAAALTAALSMVPQNAECEIYLNDFESVFVPADELLIMDALTRAVGAGVYELEGARVDRSEYKGKDGAATCVAVVLDGNLVVSLWHK